MTPQIETPTTRGGICQIILQNKTVHVFFLLIILTTLPLGLGCSAVQRKFLYFPTHSPTTNGLAAWIVEDRQLGFVHKVDSPQAVWLFLHGNAGQAADRVYALGAFPRTDAVYIMEYPGYGLRAGTPSKDSFTRAAREAYSALRAEYPTLPVGLVGESLGSGPASLLTQEKMPPDKVVLVVPFDRLERVAARHFSSLLAKLFLRDTWDNIDALKEYRGPLKIFGAKEDAVIPLAHARALAASKAQADFFELEGGHNEWVGNFTAQNFSMH